MGQKMVEYSDMSYENEMHRVDSPSNKDSKYNFFAREAQILEKGRLENLGKMAKNRKIYCYANQGVVSANREYWPLPPGTKIFALLWFSCMLDQIGDSKNILKQRKYLSPCFHTNAMATENMFYLVFIFIFGFPYYLLKTEEVSCH